MRKPDQKAKAKSKAKVEPEFVRKTDAEWRKILTQTQYMVTRQKATEPAFSGNYATRPFPRHVSLRLLRCRDLQRRDQVRFGNRLAQLRSAGKRQSRRASDGLRCIRAAGRGDVPSLRRPSGTPLRRWSDDDRAAVLHQLGGDQAQDRSTANRSRPRLASRTSSRAGAKARAKTMTKAKAKPKAKSKQAPDRFSGIARSRQQ